MTSFGKKLKEKGVTLYALSRDTGVSWPTLRSWVTGKRKPVINDAFFEVCEHLKSKYGIIIKLKDFKNGNL
jgi:DNA-binding Xre family transcriptional regulator